MNNRQPPLPKSNMCHLTQLHFSTSCYSENRRTLAPCICALMLYLTSMTLDYGGQRNNQGFNQTDFLVDRS